VAAVPIASQTEIKKAPKVLNPSKEKYYLLIKYRLTRSSIIPDKGIFSSVFGYFRKLFFPGPLFNGIYIALHL
jgi:hypothetical protein